MSVWLPTLPIDLVRRRDRRRGGRRGGGPDGSPILLVGQDRQRQVVLACCESAREAGVTPGLPVAEAGGLLPSGARVEAYTPESDAEALRAIAVWSRRFSPVVAPDPPDGVLLDATGCGPVHGGEEQLVGAVVEGFARHGLTARAAIAPTFGCAWALARFGDAEAAVVPEGGARNAIAPLPTRALRIDADVDAALAEVGIERVEHLLNLPRSTLPPRFGPDVLLRLDLALGHAIETIEPVRPSAPPEAERVFDGPTTRWDALELTVRGLLAEVCDALRARESGARRIEVELDRSDLDPTGFALSMSQPCRDARHLWSLARPQLERAHLGFGVEGVRARASRLGRLPHEQRERWREGAAVADAATERAVAELTDTLTNRLGPGGALVFEPRESHVPERAGRLRPVGIGGPAAQIDACPRHDRPTLLIDPPEPVRVMALTPDGPVMSVNWRGEDRRIVACIGPERIGPEWWAGDRSGRDYFKAQDERGQWLWVRRDTADGRWSVHGVWA
ncbi:MAG: DNA polymerase Y family protein [Phycisphaerales bacterium]